MVGFGWFKGLFKQAPETTLQKKQERVFEAPTTLMKFDPGKLFKGHSGSIYVDNYCVCFYNKYFSGDVTQEFHKDGIVIIKIAKYIRNAKWLDQKLDRLGKRLNINGPVSLCLEKDNIKYVIGFYSTYSSKEYTTTGCGMMGHFDSINKIKQVGRGLPVLLNRIKSLDEDYLVDMMVGMNPDSEDICLNFNIDPNILS